MLQLNPAASRDTLARAASRLAGVTPDAGYSPAALHSRAVVLKAAVDFLSDPARRRSYDKCHAVGQPQVRCQQSFHLKATRCLCDGCTWRFVRSAVDTSLPFSRKVGGVVYGRLFRLSRGAASTQQPERVRRTVASLARRLKCSWRTCPARWRCCRTPATRALCSSGAARGLRSPAAMLR